MTPYQERKRDHGVSPGTSVWTERLATDCDICGKPEGDGPDDCKCGQEVEDEERFEELSDAGRANTQ